MCWTRRSIDSWTGSRSLAAGEAGGVKIGEPVVVDIFLDAGDALVVDVDEADDVRGGRAARIEAPVLGEEADAGNAERVDLLLLRRA